MPEYGKPYKTGTGKKPANSKKKSGAPLLGSGAAQRDASGVRSRNERNRSALSMAKRFTNQTTDSNN